MGWEILEDETGLQATAMEPARPLCVLPSTRRALRRGIPETCGFRRTSKANTQVYHPRMVKEGRAEKPNEISADEY